MKKPTYNELVELLEACLAELESCLDTRTGMGEHPDSGDLYDVTALVADLPGIIEGAKRQ